MEEEEDDEEEEKRRRRREEDEEEEEKKKMMIILGSSFPFHMKYINGRNKRDISVDKKKQLDATFCILYFSSNSCSTCFG